MSSGNRDLHPERTRVVLATPPTVTGEAHFLCVEPIEMRYKSERMLEH